MAAIIRSIVNGISKVGQSRDDLRNVFPWNSVTLQAVDVATTYAWSMTYKPEGSLATIPNPLNQNPGAFTVDLEGPYLIRLITNLGLATESTQYVRLRFLTILGDLRLVASGEKIDGSGAIPVDQDPEGWADEQNFNLITLLGLIQPVVSSGRILYVDPNAVGGTAPPDPITGTVEGYGDYDKVQDGIDAAVTAGASLTTPWIVAVRPGLYTEDLTFQPHVHVVGWAGGPQDNSNTVSIRTDTGFHKVDSSSATDLTLIIGITLENAGTSTDPVLRKDGPGRSYVFSSKVVQLGTAVNQGPAVLLQDGTGDFDNCDIVFSPTTAADRVAFEQEALTADSTARLHNCRITGPSGMSLNPSLNAVSDVYTTATDCDISATAISGVGVSTDAEEVVLEYSRVRAPSGTPLKAHPSGAVYAGNVRVLTRWSFFDGDIEYDTANVGGLTELSLGSVEYNTLSFPTGVPTIFATVKARSLFYDPTASGMSADNVQDALDELHGIAVAVTTLDEAYDGGIPNSGSGRRIIADQGPVEVVDSAVPSDPVPANNTDGIMRVVGGVEVGAITKPEIDLNPNPFGNGPLVKMGNTAWANQAPFGSSATIMGRATGTPLYRNYNLRLQTESTEGGGVVARTILRAGDALSNGLITPDAGSVYVQAGSGLDTLAGAAGDIFLAPGNSAFGTAGTVVIARPQAATPSTLTAAGAFVGGVTGDIRIGTNMGAVTVSIAAADNLAAVLAKFDATLHLTAVDSGGGVIRLTTQATGPNAELFFLSADAGVDAALGTFNGQIPVQGTWPEVFRFWITAANEITLGVGGATGPMVYNSDTGKLTVPGVIDPTALMLTGTTPFTWTAGYGTLWTSDGSGGTTLGDLYYIHEFGASSTAPINLAGQAAIAGTIQAEDEGVPIAGRFDTLDFVGPGVTAADVGGGKLQVTVSGGGGGAVEIRDEGAVIGTFSILNFVGGDVQAFDIAGIANIYIPPPPFDSHWNTSDGSNGNQSVTESIIRSSAHIATPSGGEGTPFNTGGWAATNQSSSVSTSAVLTTPSTTTGFGGDSTMTVTVYDADGVSVLDSYTTPVLAGNAVHTSPSTRIVVTITGYAADAFRFKANASVAVNMAGVFADNFLDGGRYHIVATHTPDSTTDGTGPYVYTQNDVFLDTNATTPSISGTVTMAETGGSVLTKHLSGIEYYILGSQFTSSVTGIDQLNRNTSRTTSNLSVTGTEYGLPTLNHSPFGTGAANFTGWTNDENTDGVSYQNTGWAISNSSYRFVGPAGNISALPRDPWASGGTVASGGAPIMVDTYGTTSTDLIEDFDDEARRQDSGYNGGTSPGNWTSTATLLAGEALVYGGVLQVPSTTAYIDGSGTPNANWTAFSPTVGGVNPNYSALVAPVSHYRTIVDSPGTANRASFEIVFTGTFVADATTDLLNGNLEIYVRRRASAGGGNTGPACPPLLLHGAQYNFVTFDDGASDGHIREGGSSGNTVQGTFGGFSCETGFFIEVKIINPAIKIDSYEVTFS